MLTASTITGSLLYDLDPVLGAPARGVGRVDGDHRQALVCRHLDEAVPEPRRRKAGHEMAKAPSSLATIRSPPGALAALLPLGREVEILDDDGPCAMCTGKSEHLAQCRTAPAIPRRGRKPGDLKIDRHRRSDRIACSIQRTEARKPWFRCPRRCRPRRGGDGSSRNEPLLDRSRPAPPRDGARLPRDELRGAGDAGASRSARVLWDSRGACPFEHRRGPRAGARSVGCAAGANDARPPACPRHSAVRDQIRRANRDADRRREAHAPRRA